MNEHASFLISLYAQKIGWLLFGAIFIFRKRMPGNRSQRTY